MNNFSEVKEIKGPCFTDERGAFVKVYSEHIQGLEIFDIKQINLVTSLEKFTLRGLHYQTGKHAEGKFFRVVKGGIQLCFVDIREHSTTYAQFGTIILTQPELGILVPRGFATGYCTLEENTTVLYLSDNDYEPSAEKGIRWNDSSIDIEWITDNSIISDKDKLWANFK